MQGHRISVEGPLTDDHEWDSSRNHHKCLQCVGVDHSSQATWNTNTILIKNLIIYAQCRFGLLKELWMETANQIKSSQIRAFSVSSQYSQLNWLHNLDTIFFQFRQHNFHNFSIREIKLASLLSIWLQQCNTGNKIIATIFGIITWLQTKFQQKMRIL